MAQSSIEIPETSEVLTLRITDLARGGAGVGRDASGRVIFVPFAAPGDEVRVRIVEAEKRYAQAELLEVVAPSSIRQEARCPVFGRCGGCEWQHLPYELQWKTKFSGVGHALARVQVSAPARFEELPAERVWEYRNRVQLRGIGRELGFLRPGSKDLVPISRCEIARPEINGRLEALRQEGVRLDRPYKVEVEVRPDGSVFESWNARHAAGGFRQVHDDQNDKLRAWVAGALTPQNSLYDLFGGGGNLSLPVAASMRETHVVDLGAPARAPAGTPPSVVFHRSPVVSWLLRRPRSPGPASAILDPPREGLAEGFADIAASLEKLGVTELVLVGCDPDSWARDVSRFLRKGWAFERGAVLDLFPQTHHVESLARLVR